MTCMLSTFAVGLSLADRLWPAFIDVLTWSFPCISIPAVYWLLYHGELFTATLYVVRQRHIGKFINSGFFFVSIGKVWNYLHFIYKLCKHFFYMTCVTDKIKSQTYSLFMYSDTKSNLINYTRHVTNFSIPRGKIFP